jgi:hypothetical protein
MLCVIQPRVLIDPADGFEITEQVAVVGELPVGFPRFIRHVQVPIRKLPDGRIQGKEGNFSIEAATIEEAFENARRDEPAVKAEIRKKGMAELMQVQPVVNVNGFKLRG